MGKYKRFIKKSAMYKGKTHTQPQIMFHYTDNAFHGSNKLTALNSFFAFKNGL